MQEPVKNERRRRRLLVYSLTTAILLLAFLLFSQASLNLSFIQPNTLSQTLVLTALSAVIFLGFLALTFILARNLLKLYADRQLGVLGSRFRTRMVLGGLALSFLPVLFMFLFAYVLMNRSIDKWFSRPVEELREESAQVASLLSTYAAANARAEAITLAGSPEVREAFAKNDFSSVNRELKRHEANLQGGFVILLQGERVAEDFRLPKPWIELRAKLLEALQEPHPAAANEPRPAQLLGIEGEQYLLGVERIGKGGRVVVAMPLPPKYAETIQKIDDNQRRYFELSQERRQVRRFYMQLLLLLTVLTLFAASWISIYTARLVTRPVTALAEGTKAISEGNLQYRVDITAADELGVLVSSFNRMASDLEQSRKKIEQSGDELSEKNLALEQANTAIEQRRREIETILQNVPTGVLSLDAERRLTHSNRAFDRLFAAEPQMGSYLVQIFDKNVAFDLERLLRRADRMATASRELELNGLHVEVTAASLQHDRQKLGYVLVFEDLSELLKAQKQVAWREVARRVAHEIKNPLTPIALSAERIRRHLERAQAPDAASLGVITECAATISGAVETLRALVDEFSALARFPASQPQPADINQIIESALGLFHGRLEGITVTTHLAAGLPEVQADPEAIKRVVANLVDNAADAMQDSLLREINISTSLLGEDSHGRESVEIVVTDTGHGVTKELKEKLFLPYFSTKERGTGLGLAIVSRIVEEHGGSIRVEENRPVGTRFIVELPVATQVATSLMTKTEVEK